jgi:predicted Holliday junction resolvase-like endonuclease
MSTGLIIAIAVVVVIVLIVLLFALSRVRAEMHVKQLQRELERRRMRVASEHRRVAATRAGTSAVREPGSDKHVAPAANREMPVGRESGRAARGARSGATREKDI